MIYFICRNDLQPVYIPFESEFKAIDYVENLTSFKWDNLTSFYVSSMTHKQYKKYCLKEICQDVASKIHLAKMQKLNKRFQQLNY